MPLARHTCLNKYLLAFRIRPPQCCALHRWSHPATELTLMIPSPGNLYVEQTGLILQFICCKKSEALWLTIVSRMSDNRRSYRVRLSLIGPTFFSPYGNFLPFFYFQDSYRVTAFPAKRDFKKKGIKSISCNLHPKVALLHAINCRIGVNTVNTPNRFN